MSQLTYYFLIDFINDIIEQNVLKILKDLKLLKYKNICKNVFKNNIPVVNTREYTVNNKKYYVDNNNIVYDCVYNNFYGTKIGILKDNTIIIKEYIN